MEINEILGYVTALTTIVILVLLWIRTRPVDIEDAYNDLIEAAELAKTAVLAAEQLWRTGNIPEGGRFDHALDTLQREFPHISTRQLTQTIEAAVYWLKLTQSGLMQK